MLRIEQCLEARLFRSASSAISFDGDQVKRKKKHGCRVCRQRRARRDLIEARRG